MKNLQNVVILMNVLCLIMIDISFSVGIELKPYGFIKGEMVYANKEVYSFLQPNLTAPQVTSGITIPAMGFTAMHTRFGLSGSKGDDIQVSGKI